MTPAEQRRSCIVKILRENGPCLSNYLLAQVKSMTRQSLVPQQINADIMAMVKEGLVTKDTVMGLGPAIGASRPHAQKMIRVCLVKEKK